MSAPCERCGRPRRAHESVVTSRGEELTRCVWVEFHPLDAAIGAIEPVFVVDGWVRADGQTLGDQAEVLRWRVVA